MKHADTITAKIITEITYANTRNADIIYKQANTIYTNDDTIYKLTKLITDLAYANTKNADTIYKNADTIYKQAHTIYKNADTIYNQVNTISKQAYTINKQAHTINKLAKILGDLIDPNTKADTIAKLREQMGKESVTEGMDEEGSEKGGETQWVEAGLVCADEVIQRNKMLSNTIHCWCRGIETNIRDVAFPTSCCAFEFHGILSSKVLLR